MLFLEYFANLANSPESWTKFDFLLPANLSQWQHFRWSDSNYLIPTFYHLLVLPKYVFQSIFVCVWENYL